MSGVTCFLIQQERGRRYKERSSSTSPRPSQAWNVHELMLVPLRRCVCQWGYGGQRSSDGLAGERMERRAEEGAGAVAAVRNANLFPVRVLSSCRDLLSVSSSGHALYGEEEAGWEEEVVYEISTPLLWRNQFTSPWLCCADVSHHTHYPISWGNCSCLG